MLLLFIKIQIITDLQIAFKENKDLKEKNVQRNYEQVKTEHDKMKVELEEITNKNRKLHERLKILKDYSDKIKETKN